MHTTNPAVVGLLRAEAAASVLPRHRPFVVRDLSVLAYAQGFTLWHYRSEGDVTEPGYFDVAGDMLNPGDMILVSGRGTGSIKLVAQTGATVVLAGLA